MNCYIPCIYLSLNSGGLDEMTAGLAIIILTLAWPFWSRKNFSLKKVLFKKNCVPKSLVQKKFWSENIWGPKIIWGLKNLECKKYLESKKILFRKIFDPKNFGSNNFGSLKFFSRGSKLWHRVAWTIWSLHTKSWPPTIPGTLGKVFGGWWVVVGGGGG